MADHQMTSGSQRDWNPPNDFIVRIALLEQRMAEREQQDKDLNDKLDLLLKTLGEIKMSIERNKGFTAGVAATITLVTSVVTYYWDKLFHPGGGE